LEIYKFISQRAPQNAESFIARLEHEVLALGKYARGAGLAPESHAFKFELRQIVVWRYRVLFRVRRGRIEVLHVRHEARLPA
jgi:plasmid stabilization system protein ParE